MTTNEEGDPQLCSISVTLALKASERCLKAAEKAVKPKVRKGLQQLKNVTQRHSSGFTKREKKSELSKFGLYFQDNKLGLGIVKKGRVYERIKQSNTNVAMR